jgi:hypothetical protein
MITTINPDGSCLREIYAKSDSAFLTGNREYNPYMFFVDSGWQITPLDTVAGYGKYNVKISKTVRNVKEFSTALPLEESLRPLVTPVETLEKHFRWFYTYYTFKSVYPCISEKIPVSIDQYMNKEEQKVWFQGDFSAYSEMNGYEMNAKLDEIEDIFFIWHLRNVYEIYFEAISYFGKLSNSDLYVSLLPAAKDTLFKMMKPDKNELLEIDSVNQALDKYFNTTYFSDLYIANKEQIDERCETSLLDNLFREEIEYKLIVPGKLISANTSSISRDTLSWTITALRLVADDYELTAISRTVHPWAFVVVVFFMALSVYCLMKVKSYKAHTKKNSCLS